LVSSKVATRNRKKDGSVEFRQGRKDGPTMPRSVLVVDDDPAVLAVLADMLEDLGCDVSRPILDIPGEITDLAQRIAPAEYLS
jgi:hypothetical protein